MAIAIRTAQTTWEGPLASGTGTVRTGSGAAGERALGLLRDGAAAAVLVLATAVWIGGLVAIFVVARVADATLGAVDRVAFFRRLGRAYGVALASGAVLAATYRRDGDLTASTAVAAGLLIVTVAGGEAPQQEQEDDRQSRAERPGTAETRSGRCQPSHPSRPGSGRRTLRLPMSWPQFTG